MSNIQFKEECLSNLRSRYHRDGFVIIDDVFPSADLEEFQLTLSYLIRTYLKKASMEHRQDFFSKIPPGRELDQGSVLLEEIDHAYIRCLYACIRKMPEFVRLHNAQRITDTIRSLLQLDSASPLYSGSQICRIDIPQIKGYTFGWHQEVFYQIPKSEFTQTWGPLVSSLTEGFGALEVLVGSHHEGVARQIWNTKEGIPDQILVVPEVIEKYSTKIVEIQLGQILFFSGKLVHKSGYHTKPDTRYTLVGSYHSVENEHFYPDQGVTPSELTARSFYEEERAKWPQPRKTPARH